MAAKILLSLVALSSVPFISAVIDRPCPFDNYECIGSILQANSQCSTKVRGYIKQEIQVAEQPFDTPFFNASYIDKNIKVRNLNLCLVSEFYINTETNKVVLGIDCPQKDDESDRVLIQHRSLQEDSYYYYHIRAVYPLIRVTVIFENWANLDLCSDAHFFTEVLGLPELKIDPQDKPTSNFLAQDLSQLNIFEIENFFFKGPGLARIFVKSLLCDYPCDVFPGVPNV